MNRNSVFVLSTLLAALPSMVAYADQVYRWVGPHGHVHYSQTPPASSSVDSKVLNVTPPPPDAASLAQQQALIKSVAATDAADQKAATAAERAAGKKARQQQKCDNARKQLQGYMEAHRVITNAGNANPTYYTGDNLVKFRAQAQHQVDQLCNGR